MKCLDTNRHFEIFTQFLGRLKQTDGRMTLLES